MVVAVRLALLEHRGKVRTPEGTVEVRRGDDGWFVIPGLGSEPSGRVRYDAEREALALEHGDVRVSVQFRRESQDTTFTMGGHVFTLGRMDFGELSIREGTRVIVRGHATLSGVRLTLVGPELQPMERELALGLALRGSSLDDEFWREEHPFLEQVEQETERGWLRHEEDEAQR